VSIKNTLAELDKMSTWAEPKPLPEMHSVPVFNDALLPDRLRPWIMDISERMQCPPDFPAVSAIVTLASLVGRQIAIRPKRKDDWTVVPNLWGVIVGRPGVLKTPAIQEPLRMVSRLDVVARDEHETALRLHAAHEMVSKAAFKKSEKDVEVAFGQGNRAKASKIALQSIEAEEPSPIRRRYVTSDSTIEKLGELLRDNPRGILLFRDELAGWLSSLDREGREGTRQFFLESWNGNGRFTFDRIGRGTIEIEALTVSLLGGIQPGRLSDYLRSASRGGGRDDGLMQRIQMMVWPDISSSWRNVDRLPNTLAGEEAWEVYQRLNSINAPEYGGTDPGDGGISFVRFCSAAQTRFDDWRGTLEKRLRSDELSPEMESHLAKYRSLVPSLALLFHLVDAQTEAVGEDSLLMALAWVQHLEKHANRVYTSTGPSDIATARELEKRIRRGDIAKLFVARDIYRRGWRGLDRENTEKALAVLEDHGFVRSTPIRTGGRPSIQFEINPEIEK